MGGESPKKHDYFETTFGGLAGEIVHDLDVGGGGAGIHKHAIPGGVGGRPPVQKQNERGHLLSWKGAKRDGEGGIDSQHLTLVRFVIQINIILFDRKILRINILPLVWVCSFNRTVPILKTTVGSESQPCSEVVPSRRARTTVATSSGGHRDGQGFTGTR